jgi:hypothetical protein
MYLQSFFYLAEKTKDGNTIFKTLHALAQVLHSLDVIVCLLVTPRDSLVGLIDTHVKLFLPCCNRFEESYRGKDQIPFWSTKGNFLSPLDLAQQIEDYGSFQWCWDGTREQYIQTVKKGLVALKMPSSYFEAKMVQIQTRVVMKWLKKEVREGKKSGKRTYNNNHCRYKSLKEIN